MKKQFFVTIFSIAALLFSVTGQAQASANNTPGWVSEKGYWVVVSNKHTPKEATVYFYNNDNVLVYTEEVRNQKLKLHKEKTLYRLKAALEEAISNSIKGALASQKKLVWQQFQK